MKSLSLVRKLLTFLPLLFLLGSGLLLFFLILSGASSSSSLLQRFYWLQASTPGLGQYQETKWTNYRLCNALEGSNECSGAQAALPISPEDNFGNVDELPLGFINNRNSYYYESRVGWLFLLVTAFFVILAIILAIPLIILSRSLMITLMSIFTFLAFIFIAVSASLYTHVLTRLRNTFNSSGQNASIGTKMMAFIWTTVFLLLISWLFTAGLSCCQFSSNRLEYRSSTTEKERITSANPDYSEDDETFNDGYVEPHPKKNSFWARKPVATDPQNIPPLAPPPPPATSEPRKINFFRINRSKPVEDESVNDVV